MGEVGEMGRFCSVCNLGIGRLMGMYSPTKQRHIISSSSRIPNSLIRTAILVAPGQWINSLFYIPTTTSSAPISSSRNCCTQTRYFSWAICLMEGGNGRLRMEIQMIQHGRTVCDLQGSRSTSRRGERGMERIFGCTNITDLGGYSTISGI